MWACVFIHLRSHSVSCISINPDLQKGSTPSHIYRREDESICAFFKAFLRLFGGSESCFYVHLCLHRCPLLLCAHLLIPHQGRDGEIEGLIFFQRWYVLCLSPSEVSLSSLRHGNVFCQATCQLKPPHAVVPVLRRTQTQRTISNLRRTQVLVISMHVGLLQMPGNMLKVGTVFPLTADFKKMGYFRLRLWNLDAFVLEIPQIPRLHFIFTVQ